MPDDNQLISIEEPFPEEKPQEPPQQAAQPDDDAEPEGAVEVAPGRRMVDVSVVAAERKRAREVAERTIREKEVEPLKAKAQEAEALKQALDSVKPYIEQLRQQAQPPQRREQPEIHVSDAEAEQEARDLQLYDKDSKLDVATGKKIIARRRADAIAAARHASQEAIAPYAQNQAEFAMKQQFAAMVQELGADDILTPKELAEQFIELGPELAQDPRIARVGLERAIGKAYLSRRGKTRNAPTREPVLSEAPGGRISHDPAPSETSRKMGLTKDDLKESAKNFTPGGMSPIGSW